MMYTISRGPSKLVTQRRTGDNTDPFDPLMVSQQHDATSHSPPPKIVFNRHNGKRYNGSATQKARGSTDGFTPAHEENVRFVYEAWQEVEQKLGDGTGGELTNRQRPIQYTEKTPSAPIKNFVPIDLEEWWAQRFLANIANLA
uniref:MAPK regulated corepressor interacting protein 2 n=1 Tax=Cynoglossus semilaevis TaxID=244447 RepID=A0A3P8VVK2_CYNSE